ncbi:MAG: MBL fold metallo-hydrolase [Acidobacteria bacterium]|nr:MBL fold metallo-hydrolase [Acidobacteriota bacterium]
MSLRTLSLETSWGRLTLAGGSRAGEATMVLLPQLRLALDAGRAHRALPPMSTVFLSHGHLDHAGGLPYWASQRFLNTMGQGTILAPRRIADQVVRLLHVAAELEGGRPYRVDVLPLDPGERHPIRRDVELETFATDHWVPTLGCRLLWSHRHLKPELAGLPGEEIARRRRAGEEVTSIDRIPILSYCADTGPGLFTASPQALEAEIVLLECSFYRPADRDRARRFGHLHLDDLVEAAPRIGARHLIILHPSRRQRLREVARFLDERLAPNLDATLHHLAVDWE